MKRSTFFTLITLIVFLFACFPGQPQTATPTNKPVSTIPATTTQTETPTSTQTQVVREVIPVEPVTGMPEGTDGYPWWNDSVFYEIYVRSFYDSDGDGIGDINGIIEKLDYLNDGDPNTTTDLGITGIWLMPIFASPTYHGYNVTNFYDVNPQYGTLDDLRNLLAKAHKRGIRIILDISFNVTSNQHPWFISAASPSSPYHDWYVWSNYDPGYTGSWGQQVWFPLNGRYYYSTFSAYSPDLNHLNPEVGEVMQDVVRFWLEDVGMDGFRLDSAKHMIEEGTIQANSDSTHQWWKEFRTHYKQINPQAMTVGEIWDDTHIIAEYLQGDEFDLSFEFYLAGHFIQAANNGDPAPVNDRIALAYDLVPNQQFAVFLTNHDQDRLMSQVFDHDERVKVAASLLLTSPGVPFLYYGEEVGLQGEWINVADRRPMQWSGSANGGFTTGIPWEPLGPAWQNYNVELEAADPISILSHYQNLIQARNEHAALRIGNLNVVTTTNEGLYSILRVSENEAVLVMINLSDEPATDFFLAKSVSSLVEGSYSLVPIMGEGVFDPIAINASGGFFHHIAAPEIPPYATIILQLLRN